MLLKIVHCMILLLRQLIFTIECPVFHNIIPIFAAEMYLQDTI